MEFKGRFKSADEAFRGITAGNATITLVSKKDDARFAVADDQGRFLSRGPKDQPRWTVEPDTAWTEENARTIIEELRIGGWPFGLRVVDIEDRAARLSDEDRADAYADLKDDEVA